MQFEAGARMILDAVLLTIADISLDTKEKCGNIPRDADLIRRRRVGEECQEPV